MNSLITRTIGISVLLHGAVIVLLIVASPWHNTLFVTGEVSALTARLSPMVLPNLALAVPAHYLPKPTTSNLNSKVDPTPPATPQPIVNHVSHGELTFLRPAEVDQTADLLTAFDGGLFDDAINLKGEVTYEIAVTRTGAIVAIELVSYADDGLKIDEILRPWLRAQQYTPAKKNGVAVNSIASFDLILGRLDRGKIMPPRSSVNISPPRQDERGNPLANSNNSSVFNRTIRPASPP